VSPTMHGLRNSMHAASHCSNGMWKPFGEVCQMPCAISECGQALQPQPCNRSSAESINT